MNKFGNDEDIITAKEFQHYVEDNLGEFPALIENKLIVLVEKSGDGFYNLCTDNIDKDYSNLDDLFNDKVINGKSINDFKVVDMACY